MSRFTFKVSKVYTMQLESLLDRCKPDVCIGKPRVYFLDDLDRTQSKESPNQVIPNTENMSSRPGHAKKNVTLLQTLVEDSIRHTPNIILLIDDIETMTTSPASGCWALITQLIHGYVRNKKAPKHVTILSLDECDKNRVCTRQRNLPNVTITSEYDFLDHETVGSLFDQEVRDRLLINERRPDVDNVLIIDSIGPLLLGKAVDDSMELSVKSTVGWLKAVAEHYSHCLVVYHSDAFDSFTEKCLSNVSNAIVDFRLHSTDHGMPKVACLNLKSCPDTVHCMVTVRQKHPRTNYKIIKRHEHFRLQPNAQPGMPPNIEYISAETLQAQLALSNGAQDKEKESKAATPATTFNLELNEEALEARKKLILPYIKQTNQPTTGGGDTGGQIIYHFDKFDDFDEDDDPDDDLNF